MVPTKQKKVEIYATSVITKRLFLNEPWYQTSFATLYIRSAHIRNFFLPLFKKYLYMMLLYTYEGQPNGPLSRIKKYSMDGSKWVRFKQAFELAQPV